MPISIGLGLLVFWLVLLLQRAELRRPTRRHIGIALAAGFLALLASATLIEEMPPEELAATVIGCAVFGLVAAGLVVLRNKLLARKAKS